MLLSGTTSISSAPSLKLLAAGCVATTSCATPLVNVQTSQSADADRCEALSHKRVDTSYYAWP
jgi:hypothetical protein